MATVETKERPCSVLIIEDDQDDVFLFRRALEGAQRILHCEIECDQVDNGLDAILLVSRQQTTDKLPDALVLDLNIPLVNGIKFLRCMRKSVLLKNLPVFVLTTSTAAFIHEEAMQAGADKVFVKPNNAEALLGIALEIVIGATSRRSGEGSENPAEAAPQ